MKTEIKFRVWDKDHNKMLNITQIWWMDRDWLKDSNSEHTLRLGWVNERNFGCWRDCKPSQIDLMQFTGFKDKNGKEIYEGDILQGYDGNPKAPKFEVTFERGCFCWGGEPLGYDFETHDIDGNPEKSNPERWATIVGNIYEK